MGKPSKRTKTGRTRFRLSRGGENALAATGVVILIIVGIALAFWAKTLFFPPSHEEQARLAAQSQRQEAELERFLREKVVLLWLPGEERVAVDGAKWMAERQEAREGVAESLASKVGLNLLFFDDPSGKRLGWYRVGEGYKEPVTPPSRPAAK